MKQLFDFLAELELNNNREWFNARKPRWEELRAEWIAGLDRMVAAMGAWWPELAHVSGRDCAYRIYRDTRFSPDKTPYKTYVSASISPVGRRTHDAAFYIQAGPGRPGDTGLYGGLWCPDAAMLRKLRHAIVDNIEEFEEIINAPKVRRLYPGWCGSALKTIPKGWNRNHPQAELLRLKDYGKWHPLALDFFDDPSWPERAADLLRPLKPFVDFLNYSLHE